MTVPCLPDPDATSILAPTPTGSGAVDAAIALWRALAALGVRDVVLAPGSRSAPLVYGLADDQVAAAIRPHVRIDERSAAFTALGISRHDNAHPGVVATTSGTAVTHVHAAVLEAHHARVPLVVLTADRPAELRDTGANQTTHQAGIFGDAVRFAADLPAPTAGAATEVELRTLVSTLARAVAAATGPHPGPVHLNLGFRDPLVPAPDRAREHAAPEGSGEPRAQDLPAHERPAGERIVLTRRAATLAPEPVPVPLTGRTVVVAGDGAGAQASELASRHDLPLLAEPSSGARAASPALIPGYPRLLSAVMGDPDHPARPDQVLVLGHPTLSRPVLSRLLGDPGVDVVVVDPTISWPDAARRARLVVPAVRIGQAGDNAGDPAAPDPTAADRTAADPAATDPAGTPEASPSGQREFLAHWQRLAEDAAPDRSPQRWQERAALAVWEACGPQDVLVLGSSSLVRDLEDRAGTTPARILANRGLAGIDGLVSTATGVALARRGCAGRVRLLIGDLTAVHDLTGLVIGPDEVAPDLDIVVVDDGGGRIFGGLEHAAAPAPLLRRFFTTPHGIDLAGAATALGVAEVVRVDANRLAAALAEQPAGRRLLLVQS